MTAYAWGTSADSTIQTPAVRPAIFATIPVAAPEPGSLTLLTAASALLFLSQRRRRTVDEIS